MSQINKMVVWLGILLAAATIMVCALTSTGCHYTVGPFVPRDAKPCSYDGDCPRDYACKFPAVDTRAVCMPGNNALDEYPHAPPPEPFR